MKTRPGNGYIDIKDVVLMENVREVGDVDELAASIKAQGIIEPLVVRPFDGGKAELVCGYRRHAAAKLAGLKIVPVVFREMDDAQVRETQLTENLHRKDLGPLDEARAFKAYLDATQSTQQVLAEKIGKTQSYVSKRMALLGLPAKILKLVVKGDLSPAHAKVLAAVPDDMKAMKVDNRGDGVDTLEYLLAEASGDEWNPPPTAKDFAVTVQNHVSKWKREIEKAAALAALKPCPVCALPASAYVREYDDTQDVCCKVGHMWNGKSGKELKAPQPRDDGDGMTRSKPVKKSRNEPGTIRSMHEPYAVAKKLLAELDPADVTTVLLTSEWNDTQLRITVKKLPASLKDVDVRIHPHRYSTGEVSEVHLNDGYGDDKERKKIREAFRAWEEAQLPRRVAKEPPLPDAKLLDGTIAKVVKQLQGKDDLVLEELRKLEVKGKARAGVLDHIDARLKGA